jgi:hypothetical protein
LSAQQDVKKALHEPGDTPLKAPDMTKRKEVAATLKETSG